MDGIYIDENECTMHVFQIKNSKGLGDNVLSKFINDYRNIFAYGNSLNIPLNSKVQSFLERYTSIVSSGKIVDIKLYFIFAGEKEKNDQSIIQRHLDDNSELSIYDINDLYDRIDTLISEHKKRKDIKFSFMAEKSNNGITIISEQLKIPNDIQAGYYPIETKNPVIVNGLQTTSVIYDIYQKDRDKLDGVYVLIRLYETNDPDIVVKCKGKIHQ